MWHGFWPGTTVNCMLLIEGSLSFNLGNRNNIVPQVDASAWQTG
jgi:hypothetical protein